MVGSLYTTTPEFYIGDVVGDLFDHLASSTSQYQNKAKRGNNTNNQARGKHQEAAAIIPDLDIYESVSSILLEIALPGVAKEHVNVEYDQKNNRVLISGEVHPPKHDAEVKAIRQERPTGKFERVVGLNTQQIVAEKIEAAFKDGVLTLQIPKDTKSEEKRKINIA